MNNIPMKIRPYNTFNNLFDTLFNDYNMPQRFNNRPAVNIAQDDDAFYIELAAPGLEKEDFNITVEKDQLIISVAKESVSREGSITTEFDYYRFSRSFHLSDIINRDDIHANYDKGILKITLGKKDEAKSMAPMQIEIS